MDVSTGHESKRSVRKHARVGLVNEFPLFSESLGLAISSQDDLEYVGAATTSEDALDLVMQHEPDVVLVDIDIPSPGDADMDGISIARVIKGARPEVRVLVLSARMELDTMARAATGGACGFLPKTSSLDEICVAIRTAKDGGIYVERELVVPLLETVHASARRTIGGGSARAVLTDRELGVLTLLGEGLDVTVIAKRLGITVNTCRGHVKNLLVKLGSHSQLEAVVEAVHQGLLPHLSR
jgi:DNA-binding NarL/FixJ family response regulator